MSTLKQCHLQKKGDIILNISPNNLKTYCVTATFLTRFMKTPTIIIFSLNPRVIWYYLLTSFQLSNHCIYNHSSYIPFKSLFLDFWRPFEVTPMIDPIFMSTHSVYNYLSDCSYAVEYYTQFWLPKHKRFSSFVKNIQRLLSSKDHQAKHLAIFLFTTYTINIYNTCYKKNIF